MEAIKNENELVQKLAQDIESCGKEKIVLVAGHFPIIYTDEGAVEAFEHWGEFTQYTLELACKIGQHGRLLGKEVKFVFFVDDHAYEDLIKRPTWQTKKMRHKLYKERSGVQAKLHPVLQSILARHGFSEKDVLRHDHGKKGREDCLYFSEKLLRTSTRQIENICAREYVEFIEHPKYFDKENSHLISFVPQRCKEHICNVALDQEITGVSASHVFIETMLPLSAREDLFRTGRGVTYRRDA